MRHPRLSIGMPVRNGQRFIRQAIDSLLAQTFEDFELLIFDNASTDMTEQICREYTAGDDRVSYHRNARDVGPAENYNRCFRMAVGRYFKWAAHDDICLPSYLEKCVAVLDSDESVVNCHSRTRIIDEQGRVVEDYAFRTSSDSPKASTRFGRLINVSHRRHAGFEIFGVMPRDVMATVPEQGAYAHADRVFNVRMSLRGRFHEVDEYLFLSRRHDTQSMARRRRAGVRDWLSRYIGDGPLPPAEWWDKSLNGRIVFPDCRLLREYYASIDGVRLPLSERIGCELYLGLWVIKYWPKLARDVVFAGERLLTRHREQAAAGVERLDHPPECTADHAA